jgi:hypothetical protein
MAIDFTLTPQQRELQLESRRFALEVLAGARAAELLPTAEERFLATRPVYEAMLVAGFLRKCIPQPAGGENAGLIDTAIMAEEFYSVNASVTLTMLGTVLGLLPILLGGTPEQCGRLLAPFLSKSGTPLAGFCSSEPGGSANAASPPPGEGVRTFAKLHGDRWVINGRKKWVSSATGWDRKGADILCVVCRTALDAPPEKAISIIAVERPASGIVFERAIESVGHRRASYAAIRFRERFCAAAQPYRGGRRRPRSDGRQLYRHRGAGRYFRRGVDAGGVRLRPALRSDRTARRRSSDHRASGGGICVGRREDDDRSDAVSELARVPRCRHAVSRRRRACDTGQDLRLGDGSSCDHRSDARRRRRQL